MNTQPEALQMAEELEIKAKALGFSLSPHAAELRRLHALNQELVEALRSVHQWMENQADGQSKGGHATFDLMMLREQRDIAHAALAKASGSATQTGETE